MGGWAGVCVRVYVWMDLECAHTLHPEWTWKMLAQRRRHLNAMENRDTIDSPFLDARCTCACVCVSACV